MKVEVLVTQLDLTLCDPMNCSPPGPSLPMEFSRQEFGSGLLIPSPGESSWPRVEPRSLALQTDSLLTEPPENDGFLQEGRCGKQELGEEGRASDDWVQPCQLGLVAAITPWIQLSRTSFVQLSSRYQQRPGAHLCAPEVPVFSEFLQPWKWSLLPSWLLLCLPSSLLPTFLHSFFSFLPLINSTSVQTIWVSFIEISGTAPFSLTKPCLT